MDLRIRPPRLFAGIACVSAASLLLEVTLTRVFSLTMWYHFAFMSVSLALLGSAAAGVFLYLAKRFFPSSRLSVQLPLMALLFSLAVLLCFMAQLGIPFMPNKSLAGGMNMLLIYAILAVPFFLGGLCLTLALTHLAQQVSRLYFADLSGAALGCLLALPALANLGGPGAVIAIALLAACGAVLFSFAEEARKIRQLTLLWVVFLLAFGVLNARFNLMRVVFVKGELEEPALYERWNTFSRFVIFPPRHDTRPPGWGVSDTYQGDYAGHMVLDIEAAAETELLAYDGSPNSVPFLRYDVTNLAYHLKEDGQVLVIGPGGGRDVLSALLLGQREVTGVEINPLIVDAVKNRYGDYTGHLYDDPRVHIVIDEARNYIARSNKQFDIIQASLIDTWAATAAGAFALTENNLYTTQAFQTYYRHLNEDGILTMSRWYFDWRPEETLRLVALALSGWRSAGVQDPSAHLMLVGRLLNPVGERQGLATLLMKRSPFTAEEVRKIESWASQMQFAVFYTPLTQTDARVAALAAAPDIEAYCAAYPQNISPPTDDRPFFFNTLRLRDLITSPTLLTGLLVVVAFLTVLTVLAPLLLFARERVSGLASARGLVLYFVGIGLGFMLLEMPLMQRFILFLGHPTYALAVVLFSLLLFGGLGSYSTQGLSGMMLRARMRLALVGVLLLGGVYLLALPATLAKLIGLTLGLRIALTVLLLAPLGLFMGMPFALGVAMARETGRTELIPWLWAINGSASVLSSVLAVVLATTLGFTAAMAVGLAAYAAVLWIQASFRRLAAVSVGNS
jgi:spermidine synthase